MKVLKIAVLAMGIIIALLILLIFIPFKKTSKISRQTEIVKEEKSEKDLAIKEARKLFEEKKKEVISIENGPCLSEEIIADWAADIAHNPRQAVDNKPENQCQSYREGKTHHFVELDPEGNLIKAL